LHDPDPALAGAKLPVTRPPPVICQILASMTALASAILTVPDPSTLTALRFLAPKTAPKPPMRALTPLPVISAASLERASPTGRMQRICGRPVV
jgi:hypothetical protein